MADVRPAPDVPWPPDPKHAVGAVPRHRRRAFVRLSLLGLVAIVVTSAALQLRSGGASTIGLTLGNVRERAGVAPSPAPAFQLPGLGGSGVISSHDLRGAVAVINFWASWCAPCRLEAPGLERTWEAYRDRGVRFLGIDTRDQTDDAAAFTQGFGITYPNAVDASGSLAGPYRIQGLPTTLILDPAGQIVYRFEGRLDETILRSALEDVIGRSS